MGDGARPARLHAEGGPGAAAPSTTRSSARPRARHAAFRLSIPVAIDTIGGTLLAPPLDAPGAADPGGAPPEGAQPTQQPRLRRSYGVLFDGKLNLFRTAGDMAPRVVLALPQCRVKIHHEPKAATLEVEIKAKSYTVKLSFPSLQNRWRSALELAITERPPVPELRRALHARDVATRREAAGLARSSAARGHEQGGLRAAPARPDRARWKGGVGCEGARSARSRAAMNDRRFRTPNSARATACVCAFFTSARTSIPGACNSARGCGGRAAG